MSQKYHIENDSIKENNKRTVTRRFSSIFFDSFFSPFSVFVTQILSHETVNTSSQNITSDHIDVTQQLQKNSHHANNPVYIPRARTTKGVFFFFVNPVHDKKEKRKTKKKKTRTLKRHFIKAERRLDLTPRR